MGGFAWVTLATNDSYSLGALVLAHSLKASGTAHQLAVLVTPGVTSAMRDKLASVFNLVQEVNILDSRDEANLRLLKRPELGITFTKLHCWRLTQYEKCVFLDADTLVLQHCDELFEREELSAAPDVGWPDCFNSGVFVYRPSLDTYEKLIQFALEKGSFDGGDQGLLNLYFSDWAHKDISKHLPFIYNMCSTACYSYLPAFKQFGANAKIVHFIGAQKPWLQYFNTETRRVQPSGDSAHLQEVLQRWWDIFCSLIHPMLSPAMAGLAGAFAQLTLGVPRTAEQDALENVLRKQAWEVGNIDYLGKDSFDNIWSKITETLSAAPPQPPAAAPALEKEQEPQPSAPAQSQSQSAPQEEAKPIQPSATPIDTSFDKSLTTDHSQIASSESTSAVQTPVDQGESTEISSTPVSKELVEPVISEPKVVEKEKEAPQAASAPQAVQESVASKEKELEVKPAVCPIPEKKETKGEETKIEEPKVDIPEKPVENVETTETQACPVLPKAATESKTLETEPPKETIPSSEVCPLPPKQETSQETAPQVKETKESLTQSSKKADEATSPQTAQQEAPQAASPVAESPKITSQEKELPKAAQEVSKSTKLSTEEIKVPAVVQQPEAVPEKQIVSSESPSESLPVQPLQQVQTSSSSKEVTKPLSESLSKTPEVPSKSPQIASKAPEAALKAPEVKSKAPEATPKAPEAVPKPVQAASKVPEATSKVSEKVDVPSASSLADSSAPNTKVTEATPPATPASPLVEKTKQSLDAKASIPETPPPTEGASTPMPPPRKTDKPKKAAAKPKK